MHEKYTTDRIERHIGEANNVKYVVCWYSHTAADNTTDQPAQISENFITCYWHWVRKREARQQGQIL